MTKVKEIAVKVIKRILHVFNGTKQCHAEVDRAVNRAHDASKRALEVCEKRHLVSNGHCR